MKRNIRTKISDFLKSEEGRVGAKSPLALGVASASVLLAQTMVTPSAQAHLECIPWAGHCAEDEYCHIWCEGTWDLGTCIGTAHSHCEPLNP